LTCGAGFEGPPPLRIFEGPPPLRIFTHVIGESFYLEAFNLHLGGRLGSFICMIYGGYNPLGSLWRLDVAS
jgi:hypothetical protein